MLERRARELDNERDYVRRVVIESEPRGGTSALLESKVRAREQCTSAAVNRGEVEIVLPVDYEILGKCTYVRKSTDGVAPPRLST